MQLAHDEAPPLENFPAVQAVEHDAEPSEGEKKPASHVTHISAFRPLYFPASQMVQLFTPPIETEPFEQDTQLFDVGDAYFPESQYVH